MINNICDLDDLSFMLVDEIALLFLALLIILYTYSGDDMYVSVMSSIKTPRFLSERIFKSDLIGSIRSRSFYMYSYTKDTFIRNSMFSVLELIARKTWRTILGMIPDSDVIYSPTSPSIVWVLPDAVWPYANMVPLKPSITLSTIDEAA